MHMEGYKIMWELKSYKDKVPSSEVEKFKRDLMELEQVTIGCMVSKESGIVGQDKSLAYNVEFENQKMMIFIPTYEMHGPSVF